MKKYLIFFLIIFFQKINANIPLETMRENYILAVNDKKICENILEKLDKIAEKNTIQLAYYGAFQMIWAKHTFFPTSKLKSFNNGKKNIEKALSISSNDIEIRYLRYSIQKNCPKILGYSNNLKEDEIFLRKNVITLKDDKLKTLINNILTPKK